MAVKIDLKDVEVVREAFDDEKTGEKIDYVTITCKLGIFKCHLSPKDKTSKEMLLTMLEEEEKKKTK